MRTWTCETTNRKEHDKSFDYNTIAFREISWDGNDLENIMFLQEWNHDWINLYNKQAPTLRRYKICVFAKQIIFVSFFSLFFYTLLRTCNKGESPYFWGIVGIYAKCCITVVCFQFYDTVFNKKRNFFLSYVWYHGQNMVHLRYRHWLTPTLQKFTFKFSENLQK